MQGLRLMVGLSRDYLALYVHFLRWLLNQQLEYALTKDGWTVPAIGHYPSVKAEWMAATAFSSRIRGRWTPAKIANAGHAQGRQYPPAGGAAL